MITRILILCISQLAVCCCWSQSAFETTAIPVTQHASGRDTGTPAGGHSATAAQMDVLFATNEDCDLYINDEFKSVVSKSQHKYLKLAPGRYTYKAKSKTTADELKESFVVREGQPNEIFMDVLYVVDANREERERQQKAAKAATAVKEEKKTETKESPALATINTLLANMVSLPGGDFIMGNNKAPSPDEVEHPVSISPILFSKYEVTQQQWESIMDYNPSANKGCSACPVENVTWEEAMKFIKKLNELSNKKFRLPTEAEWEYVARMGGKTEIDKAGGPEEYIKNTAWYYGNSDKKTHPVGQKQPNIAGIYDLMGNVSEWCADWYSADYYKEKNNQKNPEGPLLGKEKVVRGGSYNDYSGDRFRPSLRGKLKPTGKSSDLGFRLVLDRAK